MKSTKWISLATAIFAAGIFYSPRSQALIVYTEIQFERAGLPVPNRDADPLPVGLEIARAFVCLALLPVCLLDEADPSGSTDSQDLLDNGYSIDEAHAIMTDQEELQAILASQQASLIVDERDTPESIRAQVQSVYPDVSKIYLDFLASNVSYSGSF